MIVGVLSLAYGLLLKLNILLFSSISHSTSVTWIYLPSGLALIFVLIFGAVGAVAIALAAIPMCYYQHFNNDLFSALGSGLISGFSPWVAKRVCLDRQMIRVDLDQLKAPTLIKVVVIFAVFSSTLQQLFFTFRGLSESLFTSLSVMAIGNIFGTMIVLYTAKLMLKLISKRDI